MVCLMISALHTLMMKNAGSDKTIAGFPTSTSSRMATPESAQHESWTGAGIHSDQAGLPYNVGLHRRAS